MIKRISLVLVISFSFIQSINAQPVTALQPAIASLSLNANNTAAPQTGTAYAIPQFCNTLTWITSFGSAPASVNTNLETSNDNITYAITDSSVLTTGESRVIFTAARFVRTVETARSGGSAITTSLVCKGGTTNFSVINAPLSVVRDSIAASSTDGLILLNRTNATAGVPVQFSPRLRLRANVWNTTVTAASNASDVWLENVPFSGPFPSGALRLAAQDPSQNSGVGYPVLTIGGFPSTGAAVASTLSAIWAASTPTVSNFIFLGDTIGSQTILNTGTAGSVNDVELRIANTTHLTVGAPGVVVNGPSNTTPTIPFKVTNSANTADLLTISATGILVSSNGAIGSTIKTDALPTVASGFGTSPTILAGSTPFAGAVNVGSGGVATNGVVNFNGTAFPSAPFCTVTASATNGFQLASASATQLTFASSVAWTTGSQVQWICVSSK